MKREIIPSLNGLRAISIIMVICYHFYLGGYININNSFLKSLSHLVSNGALGVNIFFVISGFLITTLLVKEQNRNGSISLKHFYIRRGLRIFPAYYFLLFVYLVLEKFNYFNLSNADWFSVITYTKQFFPTQVSEIVHLWSLSVEEIFYLVYPYIFIKYRKNIVYILYGLILLCTLDRFYVWSFLNYNIGSSIFQTGDALLIGCIFSIKSTQILNLIENNKKKSILIFPLFFSSILVYNYFNSTLLKVGAISGKHLLIFLRLSYTFLGSIGTITNILIGFIIIYSISKKNVWFSFLNNKFLNYIGTLSYSIYLWQNIFTTNRPEMHNFSVGILIIFILMSALFSHYIIERPFLKLKGRFQ